MRRSIVLLLVLTFALTLVAVPVSAGPPEPASGDWHYTVNPDDLSYKFAGPNVFISGPETGVWSEGTFLGVSEETFLVICHPKKGFSLYKGIINFDGEVVDKSGNVHVGTMVIKTNGKQDSDSCGPSDAIWNGRWVIIGGTGDLANIHGHGTFTGPSGYLPYEGQIHFD